MPRAESSIRSACVIWVACALFACAHPASAPKTAPAAQPTAPPVAAAATTTEPERPAPGVAIAPHGAVASAEQNASEAGVAILRRGGNAIDAAIAVAFALAVTHPTAGNLGGGGFMVVRMADGRATAIDYRETAPAAATPNMYLDKNGNLTHDSLIGARAAGVPGTVAGMELAHTRFGSLPWAQLLEPAIRLAREGHVIDEPHAKDIERAVAAMRAAGFEDTAHLYLDTDGTPLAAGDRFVQPELAAVLERIAHDGARSFYQGAFAENLAAAVQKLGGLITADDLAHYRAIERAPLRFSYRGHEIISMPPPSSGGIVLRQILGASEVLDMQRYPWRSVEGFHLYIEAARRAYADRNELLGDPDFVSVPTDRLTAMSYIAQRMHDIDPEHATPSAQVHGGTIAGESPETTHFSVIDASRNAVSNTYTLNTSFGAKLAIPGTGILLNDEMDDFTAKPGSPNVYGLVQSARNAIAPGKRMLSSMTPTIIVKNRELRAVVGTPGGPTITNTVAEIIRALIDYAQPLDVAVRAPRLHEQWLPDRVVLEPDFEPEIERGLQALGHTTVRGEAFGHANCVEVDPMSHLLRAVADVTRHDGAGSAEAY